MMQYNITYRQKDKGWQFIISYKDDIGKWKQKSKQGFKSKQEAKKSSDKMLDALKDDFKNNRIISNDYENITFKEFTTTYIEHLKLYKETNTIFLYEMSLKHFSNLDNIKLKKITQLDLQLCIDNMIKKGLKYTTIDTYVARIKVIFKAAVEQYKILSLSPVDTVYIKMDKDPSSKQALTKSEFDFIISKTTNLKYKVIFMLAGTCGLRIGEILGLTWDNVNFKDSILTINKQWKNTGTNKCGFGELKSKNSYRTVPIPTETKKLLQEFKRIHPTDMNNRVILYKQVSGLSRIFKGHFSQCGFNISIHELRHTYATLLISNGVDFKTAAKLLGHDIEQTMKTYSHVTEDMLTRATNIISNIF